MIIINLRELALRTKTDRWPDGVDSAYKLRIQCPLIATGNFLSKSIVHQLWHGNLSKIGLGTIEAVCLGLGCTPADWIIVTAEPAAPKRRSAKDRNGSKKAKGTTVKAKGAAVKAKTKASKRSAPTTPKKRMKRKLR